MRRAPLRALHGFVSQQHPWRPPSVLQSSVQSLGRVSQKNPGLVRQSWVQRSVPADLLAFRTVMGRATYDGPPGQDVKEPFQVCEPPSEGNNGFIEESNVVLKGFVKGLYTSGLSILNPRFEHHPFLCMCIILQLVLQQRSMNKDTHPGLWDVSAAGHITGSDEVAITAIRELEEELGLEGYSTESLTLLFVAIADNTKETVKDREYQWVYLLEVAEQDRLRKMEFGQSEVAAVKLVPIADYHRGLLESDPALVPRPPHYVERFFKILAQRLAAST